METSMICFRLFCENKHQVIELAFPTYTVLTMFFSNKIHRLYLASFRNNALSVRKTFSRNMGSQSSRLILYDGNLQTAISNYYGALAVNKINLKSNFLLP